MRYVCRILLSRFLVSMFLEVEYINLGAKAYYIAVESYYVVG